jgi:hypothetical protein
MEQNNYSSRLGSRTAFKSIADFGDLLSLLLHCKRAAAVQSCTPRSGNLQTFQVGLRASAEREGANGVTLRYIRSCGGKKGKNLFLIKGG